MNTVKGQKSFVPAGNRVLRCPALASANVPTYTNKNYKFIKSNPLSKLVTNGNP